MEENRRLFEDFGPNSGADLNGQGKKKVRFDLALWYRLRGKVGRNNEYIARYLRAYSNLIPAEHEKLVQRWLSHIDAFAQHLRDERIDYRDYQFPQEINGLIRSGLAD
jgi:hypothetical protein